MSDWCDVCAGCDTCGVTEPELIGTGAAARALRISRATLARWAKAGHVTPAQRTIGGYLRWDLDTLRRQIAALTSPEAPVTQPHDQPVHQPVAAAIITSRLGVLVGARVDGKPPWTFIAGEIEPGESPQDAAVREVKEETGLVVTVDHTIGDRVHPRTGRTMHYVAASSPTDSTEVFNGDPEELAEVRWVPLQTLDELMGGADKIYPPVREYLAGVIPG